MTRICTTPGCDKALWSKNRSGFCHPCSNRRARAVSVPDDFAAVASVMTNEQLEHHYGRSNTLIKRWRRDSGIGSPGRPKLPNIPASFAAAAPTMTRSQLAAAYNRSVERIDVWCRHLGVRPARACRAPKPRIVAGNADRTFATARVMATRDHSQAGQAAEFLRRFGPVVRCDANGAFDPKGKCWRRSATILTADEIIDRATRNGWNPDAWRQVA